MDERLSKDTSTTQQKTARTMSTREYERRHRSRRSRNPRPSLFSRIKRERSRSPRQKSREKEGGVFKRLGNKGKSVSARPDGHNRNSYSEYTEALLESEDSGGEHWKSRSKKMKSSRKEDDLSQPWVCEEIDPFTLRIRYFDFIKTRMPSHIKMYDGSKDPENLIKIFQAATKTERWAMPTWCHMFISKLTGNTRPRVMSGRNRSHYKNNKRVTRCKISRKQDRFTLLTKTPKEIFALGKGKFKARPPTMAPVEEQNHTKFCEFHGEVGHNTNEWEDEGIEGPVIIEAEIGGHCIHRMYVDGGSASEILYDHFFNRLRQEIKNQLMPATTPLIGFSGEIIWPKWQIKLLVKIRDEEHFTVAWMNFVVVRMLKHPVEGGVITLKSSRLVPLECAMVSEPEENLSATKKIVKERVKVAINPEYPEQTPVDMTGVPRHIVEHRWNIQEGCPSRLCVDFKDVKKACLKDGYPLQEINWKVESICGFPFKCFLNAYKSYHQIQMVKEDEEKTAFITSQGIFCYTKMPFSLRNAGVTYQRLVDKEFHKHIGRNLQVYVDDLVIKSHTEDEIVRDIEETFKTLREINMKWNLKKCTFRVEEGMFLGYTVNTKGLKVCQTRFLAKSAEKSLPFFKTLKKYTNKSDVYWTAEAKEAFKQMKKLIAKLPMLTTLVEREELSAGLEYEALIARLRIAEQMGVKNLQFNAFSIRKVPRSENKKPVALSKIASTSFARLSKQVLVEELKEKSISKVEILVVVEEEGDTWMTSIFEYLTEKTLPVNVKEASAIRRKSQRFTIINRILYKKSFLGPWLRPGKVKFLTVAMDYFTKWIEEKPVATITGNHVKNLCGTILSIDSDYHERLSRIMENSSGTIHLKIGARNYAFANTLLLLSTRKPMVWWKEQIATWEKE
uniref:Reverse transcriptase domain-containing protein n=1 Tax=Tanacetum cinerariifolium TaxID=118510 RepID=A0A6L2K7V1_TANCI|nr:reverse transcriptase domain-containing protein [Tanacetum cinerariifolium]